MSSTTSEAIYKRTLDLCFLRVMTPIFQRLVTFAVGVLLGLLLLSQMPFVVTDHLSHMAEVIFVVLGWILLRIFLQNLNDLTTASTFVSRNSIDEVGGFTFRDRPTPPSHLLSPTQSLEIALPSTNPQALSWSC